MDAEQADHQADGGAAVDGSTGAGSNDGPGAGSNDGPGAGLSDAERAERLSQLNSLIELMRPAVQADGGDLALLSADVATGVVEVQLQGACSSCAVSSSTLQGGVDRILRDRLSWVTEVRGGVDESVDPFESERMGRGGYVPSF
jgi:Fe-S cluster biogenesis protein NfuA